MHFLFIYIKILENYSFEEIELTTG